MRKTRGGRSSIKNKNKNSQRSGVVSPGDGKEEKNLPEFFPLQTRERSEYACLICIIHLWEKDRRIQESISKLKAPTFLCNRRFYRVSFSPYFEKSNIDLTWNIGEDELYYPMQIFVNVRIHEISFHTCLTSL